MQRRLFAVVAAMLVCVFATSPTIAEQLVTDANGNAGLVISKKTGAQARVGAQYAARFQAYVDDIESHGGVVRFMGGTRRGKCWSGGMHPCGKALDVCQTGRGRVDARCHLPSRHELARIAATHGLFEGGQWCHSDYGHAQVGVSAAACGSRPTTMVASARRVRSIRTIRIAERAEHLPTFDRMTAAY